MATQIIDGDLIVTGTINGDTATHLYRHNIFITDKSGSSNGHYSCDLVLKVINNDPNEINNFSKLFPVMVNEYTKTGVEDAYHAWDGYSYFVPFVGSVVTMVPQPTPYPPAYYNFFVGGVVWRHIPDTTSYADKWYYIRLDSDNADYSSISLPSMNNFYSSSFDTSYDISDKVESLDQGSGKGVIYEHLITIYTEWGGQNCLLTFSIIDKTNAVYTLSDIMTKYADKYFTSTGNVFSSSDGTRTGIMRFQVKSTQQWNGINSAGTSFNFWVQGIWYSNVRVIE